MTQRRRIPTLPGVGDPLVSAAIANDYRKKSPMEQALTRKKMMEWLVAQAGMSKDEAEVSVARWVECLLKDNPDTFAHKARIMLTSKFRMLVWWMRGMARLVFWSPLLLWRGTRRVFGRMVDKMKGLAG